MEQVKNFLSEKAKSTKELKRLFKCGIYKELFARKLISAAQLNRLLNTNGELMP